MTLLKLQVFSTLLSITFAYKPLGDEVKYFKSYNFWHSSKNNKKNYKSYNSMDGGRKREKKRKLRRENNCLIWIKICGDKRREIERK